ncbi:ditrans,polycis-polyprenyl diphosphate synthase [Pancytospora philotis]|nr:ditrans,polycis-polyprenyl diphosphate synthase [Pancytospora philotis]
MAILHMRQRAALALIAVIERIVNSSLLVGLLNRLSKLLYAFSEDKGALIPYAGSRFKGLRVAFIADGNRRHFKKISGATGASGAGGKPVEMQGFKGCESGSAGIPSNTPIASISSAPQLGQVASAIKANKMQHGLNKILELIVFAHLHGLSEVSFYCFSVKNFQRKKAEVEDIMGFVRGQRELDFSVPVRIRVHGRMDLVEPAVRDVFQHWMDRTAGNDGLVVNIFFSYSSSAEALSTTQFASPVDLLVRTSGVRRLSDFMVAQVASGTAVDFVEPLWPDYSLVHCWLTLFKYTLEEKYLRTKNKATTF